MRQQISVTKFYSRYEIEKFIVVVKIVRILKNGKENIFLRIFFQILILQDIPNCFFCKKLQKNKMDKGVHKVL